MPDAHVTQKAPTTLSTTAVRETVEARRSTTATVPRSGLHHLPPAGFNLANVRVEPPAPVQAMSPLIAAALTQGQPLDGTPFGLGARAGGREQVRVHDHPAGHRAAAGVGARAFTVGRDIVFGAGQYAPATWAGQGLLAHELLHVAAGDAGLSRDPLTIEDIDALLATNEATAASSTSPEQIAALFKERQALSDDRKLAPHRKPAAPPPVLRSLFAPVQTVPLLEDAIKDYEEKHPDKRFPRPWKTDGGGSNSGDLTWLGGQPAWAQGMKLWTDNKGGMSIYSPDTGLSTWDRDGKPIGLPAPGEEKIKRILRGTSYLQANGGKRLVDGKLLDDVEWKQHIEDEKQKLIPDAQQRVDFLAGGIKAWNETQDGFAYLASVPSHALGGVSLDDPDRILKTTRQDLAIALHEMDKAQTPEELEEAEAHVRSAIARGGSSFSHHQDKVSVGADRTITSIKVGAGVATAVVAAPLAATYGAGTVTLSAVGGGAVLGGGFSVARQGAEIYDGTRKKISWGEAAEGSAMGGALALFPEFAPVMMGVGVSSAADEFSQGHYATGSFDLGFSLLPLGIEGVSTGELPGKNLGRTLVLKTVMGVEDARGWTRTPDLPSRAQVQMVDLAGGSSSRSGGTSVPGEAPTSWGFVGPGDPVPVGRDGGQISYKPVEGSPMIVLGGDGGAPTLKLHLNWEPSGAGASKPDVPVSLDAAAPIAPAPEFVPGRYADQGPHNRQAMRDALTDSPGDATSKTLPKKSDPNVSRADRRPAPGTGYDQGGVPIFDNVMVYETQLPKELALGTGDYANVSSESLYTSQMRAATRDLRTLIAEGKMNYPFTPSQLADIQAGRPKIEGFTWEHSGTRIGRMQLVPEDPHATTRHVGGGAMWHR